MRKFYREDYKKNIKAREKRRKEYNKNNKEKIKIWNKISYELKKKGVRLAECSMCGSKENLIKHHEDYSKPYDIIILCKDCHNKLHHSKDFSPHSLAEERVYKSDPSVNLTEPLKSDNGVGLDSEDINDICECGHPKKFHDETGECMTSIIHGMDRKFCSCEKFKAKKVVFIERAGKLDKKGIRAVCGTEEEYSKYVKNIQKKKGCGKWYNYDKFRCEGETLCPACSEKEVLDEFGIEDISIEKKGCGKVYGDGNVWKVCKKNGLCPACSKRWKCLICNEEINDGEMCKCMRDYKKGEENET